MRDPWALGGTFLMWGMLDPAFARQNFSQCDASAMLAAWDRAAADGAVRYSPPFEERVLPGPSAMRAYFVAGRASKRAGNRRIDHVDVPWNASSFNFFRVRDAEVLGRLLITAGGAKFLARSRDSEARVKNCSTKTIHWLCNFKRMGKQGKPYLRPAGRFHSEAQKSSRTWRGLPVLMNVNPVCRGHFLIVSPEPEPQVFDPRLLTAALAWECAEWHFIFNSMGAGASVNHAHFQGVAIAAPLLDLPRRKLRLRNVTVERIEGWPLPASAVAGERDAVVREVTSVVSALRAENVAYNILVTSGRAVVVPRAILNTGTYDVSVLQVAGHEVAGAWIVPTRADFDALTEARALALLRGARADSAESVYAIDVDGDGDVDALSASYSDDTVAWYENDGSQSFTERIITTLADGARSVYAIDADGDGDVDALSASQNDDTVAWYEKY